MRRLGFAALGLFAGGLAAFLVGIALPDVVAITQAEGAYMMGVMFFWVPLSAIAGAIVGALCGGRKP
jgi:hypothetical protein